MKRYHGDFMLRRFIGSSDRDGWHTAHPELTYYASPWHNLGTKPYGRYQNAEYVFSSRSVAR